MRLVEQPLRPQQCLLMSISPRTSELSKNVEKLWQVDTLPYRSEKDAAWPRQDHEAVDLLETETVRVTVDGVLCYATPLHA